MNLHLSPEFKDAITATADYFKIREVYIEKDYWVTHVLKNLSNSQLKENIVFKGGTSLSKAHKCIERFSEDIDFAVIEEVGTGDAKRKRLFKDLEIIATQGLTEIPDHPQTEKRGKNRKTFYEYPKAIENKNLGSVKEVIQLEINSFTKPFPNNKILIESLVAQYLRENNNEQKIQQYDLQPFEFNVLSVTRTLYEKILSLIRLSYEDIEKLKSKIRHFYDIVKILKYDETILNKEESLKIFENALNDDKNNLTFSGDWLKNPLNQAPLFTNFESLWKALEPVYKNDLKDLIWSGTLPSNEEIKDAILKIGKFVEQHKKT